MSNLRTGKSKMSKVLALVLSVSTLGAAMASTTQSASAFPHGGGHGFHGGHGGHGFGHGWGGRRWGYAGAGLGLGVLGVAAYEGYAGRCRLVRQFDEDGVYIGRVRVCRPAYID